MERGTGSILSPLKHFIFSSAISPRNASPHPRMGVVESERKPKKHTYTHTNATFTLRLNIVFVSHIFFAFSSQDVAVELLLCVIIFLHHFFRLFRLPCCVLFGPCSHQKLPRKAGRQAELMYGDSTKSAPACGRRRDKRQQKTHF